MKKIFIAEDDFYILDIYKSAFNSVGYRVETAEDGEQVIEKLKANSDYDVMLLDIMLPKISGTEIINWCRAENSPAKNLLIYVITNLDEEVFAKKVISQGADGYFVKADMTPELLVEKINAAIKIKENKGNR